MITLDMVRAGYEAGLIKLIDASQNYGDGVACAIGDGWFYFGGNDAENMTVEEYKKAFAIEDIISDIFNVLEDFRSGFEDEEYLYYEYYLRENLEDPEITKNPEGIEDLKVVDSFVGDEHFSIYTVALAYGFYVDVKVVEDTGLIYIMENADGTTVYGVAGSDATIPHFTYDSNRVIEFVKEHRLQENIVSATYISYWEGGAAFEFPCKFNMATKEVFDVEMDSDAINNFDFYFGSKVRLDDGSEFEVLDKNLVSEQSQKYAVRTVKFSSLCPEPVGSGIDQHFENNNWKLLCFDKDDFTGYQVFFGEDVQVDNNYEYGFPYLYEEDELLAFANEFYENKVRDSEIASLDSVINNAVSRVDEEKGGSVVLDVEPEI